jgi:hypothetical protein
MTDFNSSPQQILRYWHTLEYLAPFNLEQQIDQANSSRQIFFKLEKEFEDDDLPWLNRQAKSRLELDLNKSYMHQIYFGVFDARQANNELLRLFGKKDLRDTRNDFLSCYGRFSLDNTGVPIPESLSLSSLPWALGHLQSGEMFQTITNSNWNELFRAYSSSLSDKLREKASSLQAADVRFDAESLKNLIKELTGLSGWSSLESKTLAYCFAIEEREIFKNKKDKTDAPPNDETTTEEEDTKILNSFFVNDLQKVTEAFAQDNCGAGIKSFLREKEISEAKKSNLDDRKVLEEFVAPQYIPLGRWASDDQKYQSLMQQAGVNLALSKNEQNGSLFSVNGPPGTGKSTLLRDIIAALMVERAMCLTRFENPHDAFVQVAEIPVSNGVKIPLFKPDSKIVGYEIVVASSNNTAVQNITQEIPGKDSIGQDYLNEAAYFQQVAENVFGGNKKIQPWGMVAAVLGNSDNRQKFIQRFWFDEPTEDKLNAVSLRSFLRDAKSVSIDDWKREKAKFHELRNQVSSILEQRQKYFDVLKEQNRLSRERENNARKLENSQKELQEIKESELRISNNLSSLKSRLDEKRKNIETIAQTKPSVICFLLSIFFKQQIVEEFNQSMDSARLEFEQTKSKISVLETKAEAIENKRFQTIQNVQSLEKVQKLILEAERLNNETLETGKQNLDAEAFADEDWWKRDGNELQLRAPWLDKDLNNLRARLFLQAMKLHEVFVRVARTKIRQNLSLWAGNAHLESQEFYRFLWQTFFLVVPVVSTTFASFGRMFADLGRESLGWLLIDEAGQAVPQAAAGAIWRTKNTVIVGDPLQIEPVIGLNETIIEQVRHFYNIEAEWSLLTASAQTLADRANQFGAYITNDLANIWVGCPLRVHRRCLDPMFTIANKIAYENKMVYATPAPAKNKTILGESRWIHVAGECAHGHWVDELWLEVKKLLAEVSANNDDFPNIYIISPFRDVARELKKLAVRERKSWLPHLQVREKDVKSWAAKSIGTVHTFQGKEEETVLFVLGADENSKSSAQWAANKPNMLNVASTRAKFRFYIVGNSRVWGNLRNFEIAYRELIISQKQ